MLPDTFGVACEPSTVSEMVYPRGRLFSIVRAFPIHTVPPVVLEYMSAWNV